MHYPLPHTPTASTKNETKKNKQTEEETFKNKYLYILAGGEEYPIRSCRTDLAGTQHYAQNLVTVAQACEALDLAKF